MSTAETSLVPIASAEVRARPRLSPLERGERRLGLLLLAAVVLYPIVELVITSFQFNQLTQPWMGTPFVGLENYQRALSDERFWDSAGHTALYILVTVPGAVVVGLGLALLANQPFRIKWPV